jgi:hypothetical protein
MVSLTATLSGFGPEMELVSNLSPRSSRVAEAYWRLVEEIVFGKKAQGSGWDQCRRPNIRKPADGGTAKKSRRPLTE